MKKHTPIIITPEMAKALTAAIPNFRATYERYLTSSFRRDYLRAWAAGDPEKERIVDDMLRATIPH